MPDHYGNLRAVFGWHCVDCAPVEATRAEGFPRKIDLDLLVQDLRDHPDAYQYERAARFWCHTESHLDGPQEA